MQQSWILTVFFCMFVSNYTFAAILVVDLNGGGDYTGIQTAIDEAADGDTVLVNGGEYVITQGITFRGKAITVRGERGPEGTSNWGNQGVSWRGGHGE